MKKIFFTLFIVLVGVLANAQTVDVDLIPVYGPGLDNLLVERITDAAEQPAGTTIYRVFIDMSANQEIVGVYSSNATAPTNPIHIEATNGEFYNNSFGAVYGEALQSSLIGLGSTFAGLQWDSYISMGGAGSGRIGVPYSVNENGFVAGSPAIITDAGLNTTMFNTTSSSVVSTTEDGVWGTAGGVTYEDISPDNAVMIGQFTSTGSLTFNLSVTIQEVGNADPENQKKTIDIGYPNAAPQVSSVYPTEQNVIVGKDEITTLRVSASDFAPSAHQLKSTSGIKWVEFYINGELVGMDDSEEAGEFTFDWIPDEEGNYEYYAVARDNQAAGAKTPTYNVEVTIANDINEVTSKDILIVFPNPTYDVINVNLESTSVSNSAVYMIYNAAGNLVKSDVLSVSNGLINDQISLSDQTNGFYILKLIMGNKTYNKVVIKK